MVINTGKPWCAYCRQGGDGTIIFENERGEIIDNPFCKDHMQVVCKHTVRHLKKQVTLLGREPRFVVEQWKWGYANRPTLPSRDMFLAKFYSTAHKMTQMMEAGSYEF